MADAFSLDLLREAVAAAQGYALAARDGVRARVMASLVEHSPVFQERSAVPQPNMSPPVPRMVCQ